MIIQKHDGAFNYSSTDLAALRYRVGDLKADRIVYVTETAQKLHFEQLFKAGEKCGFVDRKTVELNHYQFGSVMQKTEITDENGNTTEKLEKMKTRDGNTIKL